MIFHEHNCPGEYETVEVVPISDMHVGDPLFNESRFFNVRKWILDSPSRFVILNGDLMNTATKNSKSDVYGDILTPAEQLKWIKREFEPLRGRILAVTEGNHEARISRDTSIRVLENFCEALQIPSLFYPLGALVKLTFGKKQNGKRAAFSIYATHGRAGGTTRGGKANAMGKLADVVIADVYISAHTHWKAAFKEKMQIPDMQNNKVRVIEQCFVNSATFLEWGGYAQERNYKPGVTGPPHLEFIANPREVKATI